MRKFLIGITISAAFIFGSASSAESSAVFGLELQKPFTIPECPAKRGIYSWPTDGRPCYEFTGFEAKGKNQPVSHGLLQLTWGANTPQLIAGRNATASVIDGQLEGISFNTLGLASQERDLQALKEKYGEPTESNVAHLQNAYGAQYLAIRAVWRIGDIVVSLDGGQSTSSGLIRIETEKSIADRNAFLEKYSKRGAAL